MAPLSLLAPRVAQSGVLEGFLFNVKIGRKQPAKILVDFNHRLQNILYVLKHLVEGVSLGRQLWKDWTRHCISTLWLRCENEGNFIDLRHSSSLFLSPEEEDILIMSSPSSKDANQPALWLFLPTLCSSVPFILFVTGSEREKAERLSAP